MIFVLLGRTKLSLPDVRCCAIRLQRRISAP
jgi:hypothetical protein